MQEVDRTVSHMKDEAANFPDPADRATQEEEFSLELRTRDRERKLIKKIEGTMERIEQDDYGFCDACGVEIGIKRLEARPTATLCIDCKSLAKSRKTGTRLGTATSVPRPHATGGALPPPHRPAPPGLPHRATASYLDAGPVPGMAATHGGPGSATGAARRRQAIITACLPRLAGMKRCCGRSPAGPTNGAGSAGRHRPAVPVTARATRDPTALRGLCRASRR